MRIPENKILPREGIVETLVEAVCRHPLVVLTAPMGYGKTTAAKALMRVAPHRAFHVTVNPGMHSAEYVWDRICSQLSLLGSEVVPVLRQGGFPADNIQMQRLFERGRGYLAGRPTLLMVDDYHFAHAPDMDKLLEMMVREQMPGFCLFVISRTRPALSLDELRLKGLAAVFDQTLLTFSPDEAAELFHMHGVEDPEEIRQAWRLSEGWPASLWLSLQGRLTGGVVAPTRDIESLLESAVFSQYSPDDQRLLLQLSIFDSFNPLLVARITGDAGAPRRLRALHERNSFLTYDAGTDTYRLHSLFRSYLNRILAGVQGGPDYADIAVDACALYRRAGEWFAEEGDILQALKWFRRAGDDDSLLRILEVYAEKGDDPVISFDPEGVAAIFAAVPWSVRFQQPAGYLSYLFHRMMHSDPAEALPVLMEAAERFEAEPSIEPAMKRRIRGELELFKAILGFNDLPKMCTHLREAHRLLKGGYSLLRRRRLWTFGNPQTSFIYQREPGTYKECIRLLQEHAACFQDITDGCATGARELFDAEYALETGAFDEVEQHLMKAVYRATPKEQITVILSAAFAQARLTVARLAAAPRSETKKVGAAAEAEIGQSLEQLNNLRLPIFKTGHPLLENALDMALGYIYACLGRSEDIPRWIFEEMPGMARTLRQNIGFHCIVRGKALLQGDDLVRLEVAAQEIPEGLGRNYNLSGLIHSKVLEAIAKSRRLGPEAGAPLLFQAIELARPDGLITLLAEYGAHILPMFAGLLKEHPRDEFMAQIHDLATRYARLFRVSSVQNLSAREKEILALAAKGLSNPAIAEHLGLKLITVGKTLSNVYRKLGAKNRVEALCMVPSLNNFKK